MTTESTDNPHELQLAELLSQVSIIRGIICQIEDMDDVVGVSISCTLTKKSVGHHLEWAWKDGIVTRGMVPSEGLVNPKDFSPAKSHAGPKPTRIEYRYVPTSMRPRLTWYHDSLECLSAWIEHGFTIQVASFGVQGQKGHDSSSFTCSIKEGRMEIISPSEQIQHTLKSHVLRAERAIEEVAD